ncbi:hypothetical protein BC939DRAFT_441671 [Gamsiella multidivaricata]|uniref:uncharacterized protein n=1 Tax=Gamsiella multidivaricata TaxID=101098 RepID=UPI0022210AD1|nr:uncharacterized protein BC939DRAFT_441671 [Gamsiella multidivaricata]KAI7829362.1 hypothetical protein BC939DRAFT_441671 [Gamsiella multidivaricata]
MGGITLADNAPDDPEGSFMLPTSNTCGGGNGLYNTSLLKDLNLLNFSGSPSLTPTGAANILNPNLNANANANASANGGSGNADVAALTFSISDFLVPALQTKVWEDWQAADDFTSAFETQNDLHHTTANGMPFHLGLDSVLGSSLVSWDNDDLPEDQAYDEFVFDLPPSAFEPPTVNVADLIVGPHSVAGSTSVSPLELLAFPNEEDERYRELMLANLYGFTEPATGSEGESSSSESEEDDAEDSDDEDDEDEGHDGEKDVAEEPVLDIAAVTVADAEQEVLPSDIESETMIIMGINPKKAATAPVMTAVSKPEDPNKRRMEESLAARISNDLGPEHMAGLFKILKGDQVDDEDEEMEVDLSCLDETMLVQVYQYVETCCMQTMGSIVAAEQRAALDRAHRQKQQQQQQQQYQYRHQGYEDRTPELSPSYSSSSSPSPPHSSSHPVSPTKGSRNTNKKRNGATMASMMVYQDANHGADQDPHWNAGHHHPYKATAAAAPTATTRRKRSNTAGSRKMQKDVQHMHQQLLQQEQQQAYEACVAAETMMLQTADDEMDVGEDAEIDVVGI